jgi:hypothetical protein
MWVASRHNTRKVGVPSSCLAALRSLPYSPFMNAAEVIREIEALPPEEQAKVVQFARKLDAQRKLSPEELGSLAERLASTGDPVEAAVVREEIVAGFYGAKADA